MLLTKEQLDIVQILMARDGLDEMDAQEAVEDFKEQLEKYLETQSLVAIEQLLEEELGLEPDYLDAFLI